jgi:hypothetical protein
MRPVEQGAVDCPLAEANRLILTGGEGGIRTLNSPYPSATYRFYVAKDAKFAVHAPAQPGIAAGTLISCRPRKRARPLPPNSAEQKAGDTQLGKVSVE